MHHFLFCATNVLESIVNLKDKDEGESTIICLCHPSDGDKEMQTLKETEQGDGFNSPLKQKKKLSPPSLILVSGTVSICHRLKMKEIESKGGHVRSDQWRVINAVC